MCIEPLSLPGVLRIASRVHRDGRGWFMETWNQAAFDAAVGAEVRFVQDNHSHSARGVLRGLHYQLPPFAQGKLVRAVRGAVFDVAVDVRRASPTFGRWVAAELSEENHASLWIPPGFAHGFLALRDGSEVAYKVTAPWNPASERSLAWDAPEVGIDWPSGIAPLLSDKDRSAPGLAGAEPFPAA